MNTNRTVAQCGICGRTLTPEEIEIGSSLSCRRCDPSLRKKAHAKKQKPHKTKE